MTWLAWLLKRILPAVILTALAGFIAGVARAFIGFVPGIQGMILGGVLGAIIGRLGRNDPERYWRFGIRIGMALVFPLICFLPHLVGLAIPHALAGDPTWLIDVLTGYAKEPFAGLAGLPGNRHVVSGGLEDLGWILFNLVDLGLFAFLFLAGLTLGYFPSEKKTADADEGEASA
jgi:hypothetical protein